MFSFVLIWKKEQEDLSGASFIRALTPFMTAPLSWPEGPKRKPRHREFELLVQGQVAGKWGRFKRYIFWIGSNWKWKISIRILGASDGSASRLMQTPYSALNGAKALVIQGSTGEGLRPLACMGWLTCLQQHSTTVLTSLFYCHSLSLGPWLYHQCTAPCRTQDTGLAFCGIRSSLNN